ncbi:MAG: MarR family transcriptional regulator [Oscillospiraceae bacterium]|jgi:DNA-binding MarR family transcriptional regulator|nr:MarR family transcriptional regulator [Oscillospiraceae bacterium]
MAKTIKKTKNSPVTHVNDIAKLFDAHMRIEMFKNGMRASYRQLLYPLSLKDGVTQLDLVRITKLKAPTISTTLRNMETDGLVKRETDKDDARATRVYITEKGKETEKKMRASGAKIERAFLYGMSADEKEQLVSFLGKMKENMEKISGIPADDEFFIED